MKETYFETRREIWLVLICCHENFAGSRRRSRNDTLSKGPFPLLRSHNSAPRHDNRLRNLSKPIFEPSYSLLKCTIRGKFHLFNRQIAPERETVGDSSIQIDLVGDLEIS